jgi:hypothetical protein
MKTVNLLCTDDLIASLDAFAEKFFRLIGVVDYEKRQSGHYVDETYFVGSIGNEKITIALSDEEGFDDLLYWICFEADSDEGAEDQADLIAKDRLIPAGMRVSKIEEFGKRNMRRIDY